MRRVVAIACALGGLLAASGCGYRPAYEGGAAGGGLHVVLSRALVPDAVVAQEVVAGVREELARAGALAPGGGYPRAEIEVLRADEASEAIARGPAGGPVARGLDLAVVARGWIVDAPGAPPSSDTGDLRAEETISVDEAPSGALDPRAHLLRGDDAQRAAGRRLGRKVALRLLGQPVAAEGVSGPP